MKILFDLNVLLDVAYRPQRYPHSVQLYHRLVATRQHQGTFPACGYTTLYYQLRRNLPSARDARETLLAQSVELLGRKRRPKGDVGHERQRLRETSDRHVQADGGRIEPRRAAEIGAEEVDGVRELK